MLKKGKENIQVLISLCPGCGYTGEFVLISDENAIPVGFFEQECVHCACTMDYFVSTLSVIRELGSDDIRELQNNNHALIKSGKPNAGPDLSALSERFWTPINIEAEAKRQGVKPVGSYKEIAGGWPEDESFEDFIMAINGEGSEVE